MGLSLAWALARDGQRVSVFEQGMIPNALASSYDDHRLIRTAYGDMTGYMAMVGPAYEAWDVLWSDIGQRLFVPTGTLALSTADDDWAAKSASALTHARIDHERLRPEELVGRYPELRVDGVAMALYVDEGGVLLANRISAALSDRLPFMGVNLMQQTHVTVVEPETATVTLTDGATSTADVLVVAAGPWILRLLPQFSDRVTPHRQVLAYLEPPADRADAFADYPMVLNIGQQDSFYLVPPVADSRLKVSDHRLGLEGDPEADRGVEPAELTALMSRVNRRLAEPDAFKISGARTCLYTTEKDERFIVEPVTPRCWVMTGFSGHGYKFGPLIGRELAAAIDGKWEHGELTRWAAGLPP